MANANPILDPGQAFTGRATGATVSGRRLLKVAAAKTDGAPLPVAHCGGSDAPVGVSATDVAQNADVAVYPGQVLLIEAAADISAGAAVEVTTAGKVQTLASGRRVGVAWTAGSTSSAPLIQLQL